MTSVLSSPRPRPVADPALSRRLPELRAELRRQRAFRIEQVAHLDAHDEEPVPPGNGPRAAHEDAARALAEVRAVIVAGARHALADIELALAQMDEGRYGSCRACGAAIPLDVLRAIPKTTLCLACHHAPSEAVAPP
jgi:DnaK suppressor protein